MRRDAYGRLRAAATVLAAAGLVLTAGCGDDLDGGTGPDDNQPPEVQITSPADNSTFQVNQDVTFQGSATDPEDGTLTGGALVWTTEPSGLIIGTGQQIVVDELSVGVHTITLTATDSDFAQGSASITVTISQDPGTE